MALPHQRLTIFQEDDVTPIVGTVDGGGNVTDPTCSTDPAHARPHLLRVLELVSQELDLIEGHSDIGQLTVKILDKRLTASNQATGWFTAQLAGPSIGGLKYGQLIGHRALLEQADTDTGTWRVLMNGIIGDVELDEDKVTYTLPIRDMRERERKTPAFNRANGTVSLLPSGLTMNYGQIGEASANKYLITAITNGVKARYSKNGANPFGLAWIDGTVTDPAVLGGSTLTKEQASFLYAASSAVLPDLDDMSKYKFYAVGVKWRAFGTSDPWTFIKDMPVRADFVGTPRAVVALYESAEQNYTQGGTTEVKTAAVYMATADGLNLPTNGQLIELQVVYTGRPNDSVPIYIETSFGQLLKDLYDGAYSSESPKIKYNAAAMSAFIASTPKARVKITEPTDDLRSWVEENIYKPLGYAPSLNEKGEIVPVRYTLPDPSVTLVQLDDTNIIEASWMHSYKDAVNKVSFKYVRESRAIKSGTAPSEKYFSVLLDEVEIEVLKLHPSITLLGPQTVNFEPVTVRSFSDFRQGAAVTGDTIDELGTQLATLRAKELFDRFSYGAQKIRCIVLRSSSNIRNLKMGDWVTIASSHLPDYQTGVRGINRIAQIISIQDLDPTQREFTLLDGGPNSAPLSAPTVGALSLVSGRVRVPITGIAAGTTARVDYAMKATQPTSDSGDWIFAGSISADGSVDTPLIPDSVAVKVWIRVRSEGTNKRPSAYTAASSIDVAQAHRAFGVQLLVEDSSNPKIIWSSNIGSAGVRIHYTIYDADGNPGTSFANMVDVVASAGTLTLPSPSGVLRYKKRIVAALEPWSGFSAGAVTGSATDRAVLVGQRVSSVYLAPLISALASRTGTTGTVTLTITDPQYRVTKVEFRTRQGVSGAWSAWAEDSTDPYSTTVTVPANDVSAIEYRVTAYNSSDVAAIIAQAVEEFSHIDAPPTISVTQAPSGTETSTTYVVNATGTGVTLFYAFGNTAYPGTPNLANGGSIVVTRNNNESADRLLRIKAVSQFGITAETIILVDYDNVPRVYVAADKIPTYTGANQTGWMLSGTVDDDTRALMIAVDGVTINTVEPAGTTAGGVYWANVGTTKTWTLTILQSAGGIGTVTFTPREFYDTGAGGRSGAAVEIRLERPATTGHIITDLSATQRQVVISTNPSTAKIYYRIDAGSWVEKTGGTTTFTVDVSAGDRVLEYYSKSASGVQSAVTRLVLDQDNQPEITSVVLVEESANKLKLDVGLDDDIVHWRMWAKRNGWPTDDGTSTGTPVEEYKKYDGGFEKTSVSWRALGDGGGTSTWYVIIRAYDDVGNYDQETASKLVNGAPAAVGSLSAVQAFATTVTGQRYNNITWQHNQTAQDNPYTVTIRENGVQVVTGRDVKLEIDGGSATALFGGYRIAKVGANAGDPGAEYLTFNYSVDLRRTSDNALINTYTCSMSGWYAGGGGAAAPTEVPNTLDISFPINNATPTGTWVNTSAVHNITIEWYTDPSSGGSFTLASTTNLQPNSASHDFPYPQAEFVKFRVRYYNAYGVGPWSAFSPIEQVENWGQQW